MDKLPDLPPSEDKYWDKADKGKIAAAIPVKCDHEFVHRTAVEVICSKCQVGYFLSEGMKITDGHICYEDVLVI